MLTNEPKRFVTRLKLSKDCLCGRTPAVLVAAVVFLLTATAANRVSAQNASATEQKSAAQGRKRATTTKKPPAASQPAQAAPEPVLPKPPDWPANGQPAEAKVSWNSKGLSVEATNSSLQQIMKDVATATGAKISGLSADQRVFGTYGPGPARDVISQLLDGSGYNVLMVGDQGQGTPRQIVLSKQPTGPAPAVANNQTSDDNSADVEEPPPPAQMPPPPQQPQQNQPPNGIGPGAQPRTPQQILQEMQQRQQQIQQMQQQQHPNPQ